MMRLVAFGSAAKTGPALLAAGVASLALGLYPYGAFLLLARSYYALGDSRTPAIVAIGSALLGVVDDDRREPGHARRGAVAALGIGHTVGVPRRRDRARRRLPRAAPGGRSCPVLLPIAIAIGGVIAFGGVARDARARPAAAGSATVACLARRRRRRHRRATRSRCGAGGARPT